MISNLTSDELKNWGCDDQQAERIQNQIAKLPSALKWQQLWSRVAKEILSPELPFKVHQKLFAKCYQGWSPENGPEPAYVPDTQTIESSNIWKLQHRLGLSDFASLYQWSIDHRAQFWSLMTQTLGVRFQRDFAEAIAPKSTPENPQWFTGGSLNIADSCFQADESEVAILSGSEGANDIRRMTYGELNRLSNRVANGLLKLGLPKEKGIAVFMPMTAEAVAIYLGAVKAGYSLISIADSFSAPEVKVRLHLGQAGLVFCQETMIRGGKSISLLQKVLDAEAPRAIILKASKGMKGRSGDILFEEFLAPSEEFVSVPGPADRLLNVLFSSGTTGEPKVIPWSHTTPIKCATDGWIHHNIQNGAVVAWPTSLGWMMGPWLIFASLMNCAAIALYDGAPQSRGFAEFVQRAGVTLLGVVPSLVKAWRTTNALEGVNWSSIQAFSSTGECSNHEDYFWLMSRAGYKPIIEYCGGTEIGGGYITGTVVQPQAPSTFSTPTLGLSFYVLNEAHQPTLNGEVFLVPPSVGLSLKLMNRDHHEIYFADVSPGPGGEVLRRHGDQIECLPGGYYRALGRTDDTMNLGGIKVSSAEIETVLNGVTGVSETAAIAVNPPGGGPSWLVIFAVMKTAGTERAQVLPQMQDAIKRQLNPLFKIHDLVMVPSLPRTASNKVMRRVLRDQYQYT